ncbi:MAG: hypothetical protein ACPHCJ_07400 [Oceanococcaceae bacterium]
MKALQSLLFCGTIFAASQVQAVNVATDGIGEAAVVPYYSVRDNWWTLLQITNTQDVAVAVRLHFRESLNGRSVRSMIVALSPFDVWTAVVRDDGTGVPVIRATDQIADADNEKRTCTVPATTNAEGETIPLPLTTTAFDSTESLLLPNLGLNAAGDGVEDLSGVLLTVPRNEDGGPQDIDRTREGWIEVISMGYAYAPGFDRSTLTYPPVIGTDDRILVGNAIERGRCDLVEEAFGEGVNPTTGTTRILETARQFGEPINTLRVNGRLLNVALGKESDVPAVHWANFYNPGAQLTAAADLRLVEADLTASNLNLDANGGVLSDIGGLQLVDLLRVNTGTPLDELFDSLEDILATSGPLPPSQLPCQRGTLPCGQDRDRFVFPEDNASCTITRDAQRRPQYMDWQPDGGARPDGLLRTLALGLEEFDPTVVQTVLETYIPILSNQTRINSHSCRNLITSGEGLMQLEPSLNDVYPARARFYHDTENQPLHLVPLDSTPNGYNLPEDKRGIDALSLTLMRQRIVNEWSAQAGLVGSDWIVSLPTKPFYTDRSGETGLGLTEDGGEHTAISPRSAAPILTAPFGTDLLSPTARPESIRRTTLRAYALGSSSGSNSGAADAAVGLPEVDPYPPFRESFGQSQFGDESTAASCNDVGLAFLNRASEQVAADGTTIPTEVFLSVLPYLAGGLLDFNQPGSNFGAQLCFGANAFVFSSSAVLGSNPNTATQAYPLLAALDPIAGFANMELDLFGRTTDIDVGTTVGIAPVNLDPLANANEYPEDGASMGFFVVDSPEPDPEFTAEFMRGLPVFGFAVKERLYGDASANYVSTTPHSYLRGFTDELPSQPSFPAR